MRLEEGNPRKQSPIRHRLRRYGRPPSTRLTERERQLWRK